MSINRSAELRAHNTKTILREILFNKQISRQEIIAKTGLAASTVSSIVTEILEEKMIWRSGRLDSPGTGRKKDIFMKNGNYSHVIVINLTFESSTIAVVDLNLNVCEEKPLFLYNLNAENTANAMLKEIKPYLNNSQYTVSAVVLTLPHYPYEKERLNQFLTAKISLPIYFLNNVEAMGIFDSHFLYKNSFNSLMYIFVGKGIGSAFFLNGELHMGENGYASDLGHIYSTDLPLVCRCGRTGCLETVASEDAILQTLFSHKKINSSVNGTDLFALLRKDLEKDLEIQKIVENTASHLAKAILTIISLLDPQVIILTGRIVTLNPFLSDMLNAFLYNSEIKYQDYHPDSAVLGGALYGFSIVLNELLRRKK